MEQPHYKYDIALSFAVEEARIAALIDQELKRLDQKTYFFKEAVTATTNLIETTWNVYTQESRFALVLISKQYKEKKWSGREWEAMQTVHRPKGIPYMILLRLDDTKIDGLNPNIIFLKWEGNASHTAISIYELINSLEKKKMKTKKKKKTKSKNSKREKSKKEKKSKNSGIYIESKEIKGSIISGRDTHSN